LREWAKNWWPKEEQKKSGGISSNKLANEAEKR
jgi:hypothetical protein